MFCICSTWFLGIVGFLVLLKVYCKLTTGVYKGKERLDGKTVVVTGASAGIGFASAKDFARRGARVIMLGRDMKKAEKRMLEIISETGNKNIKVKFIDLASLKSVRKCANEILVEESRIDILLNNAGGGGLGFEKTADGFDPLMQTNYFGPFLFTNILLGRIKESAPSRIVNVSSMNHRVSNLDLNHLKVPQTKSEIIMYGNSKVANVLFSNELARKLQGTGVTSNSLHPGVIPTEIARHAGRILESILYGIEMIMFKTLDEGAQTSIYLSVCPDLKNVTGEYFQDCKLSKASSTARDKNMAKKLWELSENYVNLKSSERHY